MCEIEIENLQDWKNMVGYIDWLNSEIKRVESEMERFKLRVKFHPELVRD